jgi:hypothetical protein
MGLQQKNRRSKWTIHFSWICPSPAITVMESFVFAEIAEKKGWHKRALSNSLLNYNNYPGE